MITQSIKNIVEKIKEKPYGWFVTEDSSGIKLIKAYGNNLVVVRLLQAKSDLIISFPTYEFKPTLSHYGSNKPEQRGKYQKSILLHIIRLLKRHNLWEFILNKDFIQVNKFNEKLTKSKKNELNDLLNNIKK